MSYLRVTFESMSFAFSITGPSKQPVPEQLGSDAAGKSNDGKEFQPISAVTGG